MESTIKVLVLFALALLTGVALCFLVALLFQFIFNATLVGWMGIQSLSYWQAFGLMACATLLGGGCRVSLTRTTQTT